MHMEIAGEIATEKRNGFKGVPLGGVARKVRREPATCGSLRRRSDHRSGTDAKVPCWAGSDAESKDEALNKIR